MAQYCLLFTLVGPILSPIYILQSPVVKAIYDSTKGSGVPQMLQNCQSDAEVGGQSVGSLGKNQRRLVQFQNLNTPANGITNRYV